MENRFVTFMAMMLSILALCVPVVQDVDVTPLVPGHVPRDQVPLALCEIELPSPTPQIEPGTLFLAETYAQQDHRPPVQTALVHDGQGINGPGVRPGPA